MILIADDDAVQRKMFASFIGKSLGMGVIEAEDGRDCLSRLRFMDGRNELSKISLVVLDVQMPGIDGLQVLQMIRKSYPDLAVTMLTGSGDVQLAVKAIREGAIDFLQKDMTPEQLKLAVQRSLHIARMNTRLSSLERGAAGRKRFDDIIGAKTGLKDVIDMARRAAGSDIPVLISGETGVGKEVMAHAIHGESTRAGKPFIAVNCGAIPATLIESTLFGHEKGAFTGATSKALGKFREANGGTLFLDEVGELPLDAQTRLLRVLQEQEVEPVGAGKPVSVNVRVISATNRNLRSDVEAGRFREDLFFRLNILPLVLPPLRLRVQDIPDLSEHFLQKIALEAKTMPKTLDGDALAKLQSYKWPGNVRELENTLRRSALLSESDGIGSEDVIFSQEGRQDAHDAAIHPSSVEGDMQVSLLGRAGDLRSLADLESEIYAKALRVNHGNMAQTAKALGVARATLYRKLENL